MNLRCWGTTVPLVWAAAIAALGCGGGSGRSGGGDSTLAALKISAGGLFPAFSPAQTVYAGTTGLFAPSVEVTATANDPNATISVDGSPSASGQPSAPIALEVGPTLVSIVVTATGGDTTEYTVVFSRAAIAAQDAYVKASNTGAGDLFGRAISLSGDTLVVGAPFEASSASGVNGNQADDTLPGSGAVYVFVRSGSTWVQQAYLKASNPGADDFVGSGTGDFFGNAVSISGDTIVVGAPGESSDATGVDGDQADDSQPASGAAYVFVRSGTTWSQQAYLKASNTDAGDHFGGFVSISGDSIVVGAPDEASHSPGVDGDPTDDSLPGSGAAYVFVRSGTSWSQQAYLKASNPDAEDGFGHASISGDTVVVGAPGEDSTATGVGGNQADDSSDASGAAYVFVRSGTTWTQQAYLKSSNTGGFDFFGNQTAIDADTIVVGAPGEDSVATGVNGIQADDSVGESGAVYVFVRSGTTWTQQAYLKASNTDEEHAFGSAISISGDVVVVGAPGEASDATGVDGDQADDSEPDSGAAYAFVRSGTTWSQSGYLKAANTQSGDQFGSSAAVSGDTIVVGATDEASDAIGVDGDPSNDSAPSSGAVYVFR
jgi:hypothetical protein